MFVSKRRAAKRAAEVAAEKGRADAELRTTPVDLVDIAEGAERDAGDWPLVLSGRAGGVRDQGGRAVRAGPPTRPRRAIPLAVITTPVGQSPPPQAEG
jgi:hypothetical protein